MLDIYEVRNVSKSSRVCFCENFEKDHKEIAEFLENEILKAAENGYLETKILLKNFIIITFRPNIVEVPKGDLTSEEVKEILFDNSTLDLIEKYLSFKGFDCKQIRFGYIQTTLIESYSKRDSFPKTMDDGLKVSWNKINQYMNNS
jgi:hypothetical protein